MRRKDREVTNTEEIMGIIEECEVCRLGLHDRESIYMVPMNFGYEQKDGRLTLYFHCAKTGKKIELLKENPHVGFEMDCRHELVQGDSSCAFTFHYASVIGKGEAQILEVNEEKAEGLTYIMRHLTGKKQHEFKEKWLNMVTVIKVEADTYCCKQNQ